MKGSKVLLAAAVVIGLGITTFGRVAARSGPAIFVDNYNYVTAYPIGSAGNAAPIAVTPDMILPAGIAQDGGIIFVTNPSTNTVAMYLSDATGNVSQFEVIGGSKTRLARPTGIALDQHGNIYVLNSATAAITVYALPPLVIGNAPALFNQPPIAVIAGPKTKLKQPVALAVDGGGDIYVANSLGGPPGQCFYPGAITVYAAGSKGNVAPTAIISGAATGLIDSRSIAVDSNRNIYVANVLPNVGGSFIYQPNISVYPAGSEGDAQPSAVITGVSTGLTNIGSIALDSAQNIYAVNYGANGNAINVYPTGSNGNITPNAIIAGADTVLNVPSGITLDSSGNLYALNSGGGPLDRGSITVYPSGSTGDAAPINIITSSFTGIGYSSAIATDSKGKIYLTNVAGGSDFPGGSVAIYPAGGYATTAPISVIGGDNTGLNSPQQVAVDAKGDVSVLNGNHVVTVYPAGRGGNAMPSATLNIDRNGNFVPTGIARGPGGALYVANQGAVTCNAKGHCRETSLGSIDIYPAHATGNANPSAVILGPDTNLASPSAIAVSERGNIFVANQGLPTCTQYGCFPNGTGSLTVYASGSTADAKPIAIIGGPRTRLGSPFGIAVDANENIYVLASGLTAGVNGGRGGKTGSEVFYGCESLGFVDGSSILMFKAGSDGDIPPIASIRGPFTALGGSAIAIGPGGP